VAIVRSAQQELMRGRNTGQDEEADARFGRWERERRKTSLSWHVGCLLAAGQPVVDYPRAHHDNEGEKGLEKGRP